MGIKVRVPGSLSYLLGNNQIVECESKNITECINKLELRFPGLKSMLLDTEGNILGIFIVFVNGQNIANLKGNETLLKENDEVTIIPAVAGG